MRAHTEAMSLVTGGESQAGNVKAFDNITCFPYFLSTLSFPETSITAKFLTTHFSPCHIPFRHFHARLGHPVKRDQVGERGSSPRENCLPYGSVDGEREELISLPLPSVCWGSTAAPPSWAY